MRSYSRVHLLLISCFVLALASCAGPAKLARQSDEALARGDVRTAYDRALRAIEKDPMNQPARDAYTAASRQVAADYRRRVLALASADTLAAADLALEARAFRLDVAHHGTAPESTPDYDTAEQAILATAARVHYRHGRADMAAHLPKAAVDEFNAVRRYDDDYADVAARLDAAFRAATARVVLMPFVDEVGVRGLSQEIGGIVQDQLAQRAPRELRFTQVLGADQLESVMTVAQARDLGRADAVALARRAGADWIVLGRVRGLRSSTSQHDLTMPLYHRVEEKDDKGVTIVRWEESSLRVVTREREVTVQYDFDVLSTKSGAVLAHHEEPAHAVARVAWTDYRPEEHCDRYALLPPDVRSSDPDRARAVDAQWREQMGSWEVRDLLQRARDQHERSSWSVRYRGDFYGVDTRQRPVWLGALPGEDDMAFVALHDAWRPVLATLKELDSKD